MDRKGLGILAALVISGGGFAVFSWAQCRGDNQGFLRLEQGITLTSTTNAPAGAAGKAELVGQCGSATNGSALLVQTSGLTDGTYTVSVTDDTGTNTYVLGTFAVAVPTNGECRFGFPILTNEFAGGYPFTNGFNFSAWTNWVGQAVPTNGFAGGCTFTNGFNFSAWTNWMGQAVSTNGFNPGICTNFAGLWTNWFDSCTISNRPSRDRTNEFHTTGGSFVLPAGLEATNVASVSIADSNSVVDLVGDFTNVTNTVTWAFESGCNITPGTNWPDIQGSATITFTDVHGREHGKFLLTAAGAPARQKYALFVNGAAAGSVHSDKLGDVIIKNLHQKDLTTVKTVVVTDANHNVVFSASF